jgi:alpha 1,6-mannosyltransferase
LKKQLASVFPYNVSRDLPRLMWQTWKMSSVNKGSDGRFRPATASWDILNPDFEHEVITDDAAVDIVHQFFAGVPAVFEAYDALPQPVLRADFFIYLILTY